MPPGGVWRIDRRLFTGVRKVNSAKFAKRGKGEVREERFLDLVHMGGTLVRAEVYDVRCMYTWAGCSLSPAPHRTGRVRA